ncbi:MAG: DUF2851 family protein [Bacteroidales bacterium]|nr:DUF2851 family protein [Bacteroidales bacterium]
MTEAFLHFVWKYGLFEHNNIFTDQGEPVEIIRPGEQNADAGPDFINARIKINHIVWAGNVEIHIRSSDWYRHNHHNNKAFDNVILQVVYRHDRPALRTNREHIPTLILSFNGHLYETYCNLMGYKGWISCRDKIQSIDPFIFKCWLSTLVIERLQEKTENVLLLLEQLTNNWEEAFYVHLARSFGFGLNNTPFEMLARSLPLKYIARHKESLFQTEALLFGQAGFLEEQGDRDAYYIALQGEYRHLRRKYGLKPLEKHLWKFLRVRPVNFPIVRISQFAAVMNHSVHLFSSMLECRNLETFYKMFKAGTSDYWETHYIFNAISSRKAKNLGYESINILIINTVIPFLFIYGTVFNDEGLKSRAVELLDHLPPEQNRIVKYWSGLGFKASSAFYTQDLIQLANGYCARKRCLACSVGIKIIKSGNR